ncbi:MAG: transcriptional regulator [Acidobacteriota bacterium]
MNKLAEKNYEFGPFRIDTRGRVLLLAGKPTHLAPKAFDILLLLVENHGRVLSKDELMQTIWPDVIVEEINLARQISNLRKTLAQSGDAQDYIETVPKRGYIFTAPVQITTAQQQRTPSPTLVAVPPPVFAEINLRPPRTSRHPSH